VSSIFKSLENHLILRFANRQIQEATLRVIAEKIAAEWVGKADLTCFGLRAKE
jgi:hypothetical protein